MLPTPLDFISFALECGGKLSNQDAQQIGAYFDTLIRRERLITVMSPVGLAGFCAFFLLKTEEEVEAVHYRKPWTTPSDHWDGHIAFIDLVAAPRWNAELRQQLADLITWRFPRVDLGVWYRVIDGREPARQCRWQVRREEFHGATL